MLSADALAFRLVNVVLIHTIVCLVEARCAIRHFASFAEERPFVPKSTKSMLHMTVQQPPSVCGMYGSSFLSTWPQTDGTM